MPRTGRPKSANPRSNVHSVRLSDEELALVTRAAEQAGVDLGPWMREKVVAAAKRSK